MPKTKIADRFDQKLTEEMKNDIIFWRTEKQEDNNNKIYTLKQTLENLAEKYDVSDNYISTTRISQLVVQAKKKRAKAKRQGATVNVIEESPSPSPMDTITETVESGTSQIAVRDLAVILKDSGIKSKTANQIANIWEKTIMNTGENAPEGLVELLGAFEVKLNPTKQIIMDYYGLEVHNELWASSRAKAGSKRITSGANTPLTDPNRMLRQKIQQQVEQMNSMMAIKGLKETWKQLQDSDEDDPLKSAKRMIEFQTMLNAMQKSDQNSSLTMLNEYRSWLKESQTQNLGISDIVQLMQFMTTLNKQSGGNEKLSENPMFMMMKEQLGQQRSLLTDYQSSMNNLKESNMTKELEMIQLSFQQQMAEIKRGMMTPQQYEEQRLYDEQRRRNEGWLPRSEMGGIQSEQDAAIKRIEKVSGTVEALPDKINTTLENFLDKVMEMGTTYRSTREQEQIRIEMQNRQRTGSYGQQPRVIPIEQQLSSIESNLDRNTFYENLKKAKDSLQR